jgi:hypothetical protein
MAGARLLLRRRDYPEIIGKDARDIFEKVEPARVDAVIVGQEDPHPPPMGDRRGGCNNP